MRFYASRLTPDMRHNSHFKAEDSLGSNWKSPGPFTGVYEDYIGIYRDSKGGCIGRTIKGYIGVTPELHKHF